MLDTGAKISVMSDLLFPDIVKGLGNASAVKGIGGTMWAKESVNCLLELDCGWKTHHHIKPISLPQNPKLVILVIDFLEKHGNTEFDWSSKRIRLGEDWVFTANQDSGIIKK